jgi:DNA primase
LVLALDADQAGIRAGLKSAHMALAAGFDVKVPTFPDGKDPADVARENPELLKAAIRTSKPAIEFFLDALRPMARDERAYAKVVEASVLPLIAAVASSIEQDQYIRLVAGRLGVSETAVRAEVAKKPAMAAEPDSPEVHQKSAESGLTPLDKKAGMLLYGWRAGKEKLAELLGAEKVGELEERLSAMAEDLRFRFDQEVGEHTSESAIAEDMLGDLKRQVEKERFKMKFQS